MSIYLDYNASTPVDERVLNRMIDVYKHNYGNADSRTHYFGESARVVVEQARGFVADLLGVQKDEVFFTSGATESDNIAILGLKNYAEKTNRRHIITTAIEHKAVLEPVKHLSEQGFDITLIKPGRTGRVHAEDVITSVRKDTLLVSVMHANNETGIIQPIKEIGDALADREVLFHVDAAQTFGKLVEELRDIKYDMLSGSAHKMYGPQGIGALILKKKRYKLPPIAPIMFGGMQEHGLRPGTVPTALTAGFGEACRIAKQEYKCNRQAYLSNKKQILDMIRSSGVKYNINGLPKFCMPNTINIAFEGVNAEALMLTAKQYCGISNGSACNSNSYKPSYVLEAMGLEKERISSSVRISWGYQPIKEQEIKKLLQAVESLI